MKVLNLYACLGGNRYKWTDCEVTAVELDPELARMYKQRFPDDTVIVGDAHQYLLNHYKEFDFIWSSPPCPTHSRVRKTVHGDSIPVYPDMTLYQEILLLQHYYKTGKWVVENVIPYYEPLIPAQKRGRHLYWSNFTLPKMLSDRTVKVGAGKQERVNLEGFHDVRTCGYKGNQDCRKIVRNMVDYEAGLTIFNTARGIMSRENDKQTSLFEL